MDTRPKVLVVDDRDLIRETWRDLLEENGGFATDGAASLAAAVAATDCVRYDVALVDVRLDPDDLANRDGISFVKHLRWLDEGTRPVVFTDIFDDPMLIREILLVHEAADFMSKQHLAEHGNAALIESVQKAASLGRKWQVEAADKALKVVTSSVSDEDLFRIGFKGGAETLRRAFRLACSYLVPLMPQIGHRPAITMIDGGKVFNGRFWSKGQGTAVEILAFSSKTHAATLESGWNIGQRRSLHNRDTAGLSVQVFDCPELGRAEFFTPQ